MTRDTPAWPCEAYGPDPEVVEAGAICFIGDLGKRVCESPRQCHEVMATERARVFTRINELAADGDPTAAYLAEQFGTPQNLLGGGAPEGGQ